MHERATVTDINNAKSDKRRDLYNFNENYPENLIKNFRLNSQFLNKTGIAVCDSRENRYFQKIREIQKYVYQRYKEFTSF